MFLLPTLNATRKSLAIATEHFGREHHRNTHANAFRHALWNYLIFKACQKWSKNEEKVLRWTTKITDLHEELMPNAPLAKAMDLHNNQVGREVAFQQKNEAEKTVVSYIKELSLRSKYIESLEELQHIAPTQLIHITDVEQSKR